MVFLRWDIILRETRSGTTIVALVTNVCIIQNLAGRCRHPPKNNLRPTVAGHETIAPFCHAAVYLHIRTSYYTPLSLHSSLQSLKTHHSSSPSRYCLVFPSPPFSTWIQTISGSTNQVQFKILFRSDSSLQFFPPFSSPGAPALKAGSDEERREFLLLTGN